MRTLTIAIINNCGNSCITSLYKQEANIKYMRVIGLLSTEEEVKELQFVAKICTLENRIHYITKIDKLKKIVKEQH